MFWAAELVLHVVDVICRNSATCCPAIAARIKREPHPFIMGIVDAWPRNFDARRRLRSASSTEEKAFDDIIRIHIEDEFGGKFVA